MAVSRLFSRIVVPCGPDLEICHSNKSDHDDVKHKSHLSLYKKRKNWKMLIKKNDLNAEAKLHIQRYIENPTGRLGWNSQTSIIFTKKPLLWMKFSPHISEIFVHILTRMSFFNPINAILCIKKSYRANTIKISSDSDLW